MKQPKKRAKKVNKQLRKRIRLFTAIGIFAAVLIFLMLFRVSKIVVTGNTRYTDEEIKSLVIDEKGFNNTLFFCLMHRNVKVEDVPLLASIDVSYVDRNTIMLKANEKLTIGMFKMGEQVCCIDQDGVVVEILDYAGSESLNLPLIYNLCDKGELGKKIELEDYSPLNPLHALMSAFEKYGIMPDSIYINDEAVRGSEDETVKTYTLHFGNVEVLLGQDEYLEEKVKRIAAILPHVGDMSGTLHLENFDEETENIIFDTAAAGSAGADADAQANAQAEAQNGVQTGEQANAQAEAQPSADGAGASPTETPTEGQPENTEAGAQPENAENEAEVPQEEASGAEE